MILISGFWFLVLSIFGIRIRCVEELIGRNLVMFWIRVRMIKWMRVMV